MIKNYLTIFVLSSTTLFAIFSCKKHQATPPNTFSVTIRDTVFNASIVSAIASKSAPEVLIIGSVPQPNGDTDMVSLQFYTEDAEVNRPSDYTWETMMDYYDSENNFDYGMGPNIPGSATITLTLIDSAQHRLDGTFSGVFYKELPPSWPVDSLQVTNGQFSVTYTLVP
jgi:hypothetical protein